MAHRRTRLALLLALALAAGACLSGQLPASRAVPVVHVQHPQAPARDPAAARRDWHFLRQAAAAALSQSEAGKLAASQATDPAVRELGTRLMREHTAASRRLRLLALATQIPLPWHSSRPVRRQLDGLEGLHGAAFDARYLAQFGMAIQSDTLSLFEDEARSSGGDPGLRRFARQSLPKLQASLAVARSLQQQEAPGRSRPD